MRYYYRKTRRFLLICLLSIPFCTQLSAKQNSILNGILLDKNNTQPVKGAHIAIIGGDQTKTENYGEFSLNLQNQSQPGTSLILFISHPDYGSTTLDYVVIRGLPLLQLKIERTTKIIIAGTIQSKRDEKFLEDIEVKVISNYQNPNIQLPPVKTNEFGQFIMYLDRSDFTRQDIEYIDIVLHDSSNRYQDERHTINVNTVLELRMESGPTDKKKIEVTRYIKESINVKAGDLVVIESTGTMRFGEWVGSSGPEGKGAGVFNISLGIYSIYSQFNHGALLVKMKDGNGWQLCGKKYQYRVQKSGPLEIEFEVNDNNKNDNTGHFNVIISVL